MAASIYAVVNTKGINDREYTQKFADAAMANQYFTETVNKLEDIRYSDVRLYEIYDRRKPWRLLKSWSHATGYKYSPHTNDYH